MTNTGNPARPESPADGAERGSGHGSSPGSAANGPGAQVAATPAPRSLDTEYVAPRDALETQLAQLWESVLAIAPIGVDDDFFDLGGESLHAFALISRVQRDLGVTLSPRDLFACASVAAMAALIGERRQTRRESSA